MIVPAAQTPVFVDVAVRDAGRGYAPAMYTYYVPDELRGLVHVGSLVWAPFGRQRRQGIVLRLYDAPARLAEQQAGYNNGSQLEDRHGRAIRPLADLADAEVIVPAAQLRLAEWVSRTYRTSLWEALELLLPPGVAQESQVTWRATERGQQADLGSLPPAERGVLFWLRKHGETVERELLSELRGQPSELRRVFASLAEGGLLARGTLLSRPKARPRTERMARLLLAGEELAGALESLKRAPRQAGALRMLAARTPDDGSPLVQAGDLPPALLRPLEARGWLALEQREVLRNPLDGAAIEPDRPPELSPSQARALAPIADALAARRNAVFLLHGVTGSGKTELYLRAIGRTLRQGRQAVVLVPEIALTAQLVRRFAARFGERVVVLHSGLSTGERYDTWRRLRRGTARVAVGSRSSIFAPLPELGLIVVDEEHEGTYKHEEAPRYHARDAALELAASTGSVVILGSATPSVESYQRAREGSYTLLELRERVAAIGGKIIAQRIPLPPVRIVDMRVELQAGNRSIFSRALQEALADVLEQRQQALLFLNRRGAAAFVMCRDCGHVVACPRCSSPLAVHGVSDDDELMRCHTCGHWEGVPVFCPSCWSSRIRQFGVGTQRVAAAVGELFPQARVLRWDRDVTGRKGSHERLLRTVLDHQADIIVGTQMIAKGLDLPLVTLVGVVSADTGLHLPDFRAGERSFQLMTQVAGRAGRRDLGGQVILQSYNPDHYALRAAAEHDYAAFFREEIAFRAETRYPPFSRLARFVIASARPESARAAAEELAGRIEALLGELQLADAAIIGPAPAFMERVRGRSRWHLLLRAPDVQPVLDGLGPLPGWTVDVDPVSML